MIKLNQSIDYNYTTFNQIKVMIIILVIIKVLIIITPQPKYLHQTQINESAKEQSHFRQLCTISKKIMNNTYSLSTNLYTRKSPPTLNIFMNTHYSVGWRCNVSINKV